MTAYYNIYWNGQETYKELLTDIESFGYDNYSHVLNVYEYGSILDTAKTMDKTLRMIEKGTKAFQKHSIRIRGVEHVKMMEDAYMMIAIGYFYQHNYSMSRTALNFVTSQFPKSPIRFEAMLWMARTYIQEKEYDMASSLILQVQNNEGDLYKETYRELPAVYAGFYISQEKYDDAIPYLNTAIERCKNRDFRNRLDFILGQIHQYNGRLQDAYKAYELVTKRNAKLELDYNARINMAVCYDGEYSDRNNLVKGLNDLLKDVKNERFFGRIYYVLAEIALRDNDPDAAIENLEKSVEYSGSDRDQLIISATRLADLYFENNDYYTAQKYYKSAVSVMTSEHPDYDRVNTRATNLTELVKFLEVVRYEEQMQYLASLPEAERNKEIDLLIEEYKEKQEKEAAKGPKVFTNTASQGAVSQWYFYNEQAKSFGATEFVRKWGRRENEDFWFLQNKPMMVMNRAEEPEKKEEEEVEQKSPDSYTPADKEYYLVNMPLKTAAKERSNKRLEENKFMLGAGYFDLVEEPRIGIKTLEELLQKFPNTGYKLQIYDYLYRMNMVLNNEAGKQKYRNLLLSEFPDSEQTKKITDPNYYNTVKENAAKAEQLYGYTLEAYNSGYYDVVLENIQTAESRYPGNMFTPKFKYLEIMSNGSKVGADGTISSLETFTQTYPHEKDLVELARKTIELLRDADLSRLSVSTETRPEVAVKQQEEEKPKEPEFDVSMYKVDPAAPHFCLLFVSIPQVNPETLKVKLMDFNRRSYPQDNLKPTGIAWDEDYYLIYIYTFKTSSIASGYYDELKESKYVFASIPKEFYQIMLISAENFTTFMKLRNKDAYQSFFEKNYTP